MLLPMIILLSISLILGFLKRKRSHSYNYNPTIIHHNYVFVQNNILIVNNSAAKGETTNCRSQKHESIDPGTCPHECVDLVVTFPCEKNIHWMNVPSGIEDFIPSVPTNDLDRFAPSAPEMPIDEYYFEIV